MQAIAYHRALPATKEENLCINGRLDLRRPNIPNTISPTISQQTLDLQRDALKRAKCRQVYEEHATGKNTDRPQLESCLKSLRQGNTLVVWRLDRLGRNLADLVRLIAELEHRKINFVLVSRSMLGR